MHFKLPQLPPPLFEPGEKGSELFPRLGGRILANVVPGPPKDLQLLSPVILKTCVQAIEQTYQTALLVMRFVDIDELERCKSLSLDQETDGSLEVKLAIAHA